MVTIGCQPRQALLQMRRRLVSEPRLCRGRFEQALIQRVGGTQQASGEMLIGAGQLIRCELTVHQSIQDEVRQMIAHARDSLDIVCCAPSAVRWASRARAIRDITVPIGISRAMAMSLYFISSTSQRKMTSSSAGDSASIAARRAARSAI
jgi:hypothetical protein